ncbi:MAG: hypothetical protein ACI4TG_04290 [Ruminococcus sp.]
MERLRVSVSRRSLFPILTALFGLILCVGMIQRMRDPLYPMTLEYYLFLAAGAAMAVLGVIAMRHFPWLCIIPAVCYVYGGLLQRWSELQGGQGASLTSEIAYYQIAMLVPLFLLLVGRYPQWAVWMLKGLEVIAILIPFAMSFMELQDALLELKMEGYLTDAVKNTRWVHFLMNEAAFYVGMICMTMALRYLPEEDETEEEPEIPEQKPHPHAVKPPMPETMQPPVPESYEPQAMQQPYEQPPYPRQSGQPSYMQSPQVPPTPPQQHRGGAYPYNRPIRMPEHTEEIGEHTDNPTE